MISLRVKSGPNRGERLDFNKHRIVFGRASEDVDVVVDDDGVQDVHCELTRIGRRFSLMDVGGSKAEPTNYFAGDEFVVGQTTFEVVGSIWDQASRRARSAGTAGSGSEVPSDERATQVDIRIPVPRRMADTAVRLVPSDCVVVNSLEAEGDPAVILGEHEGKSRLIFLTGPHKDRRVFLGKRRAVIGRSEDAHIPIFDARLEAYHAAIHFKGERRYLKKLGHGAVLVNGESVDKSQVLGEGDIITVGASDIEFQTGAVDLDSPEGLTTVAIPTPRFALAGQVRMQRNLLIGRDPSADLFLDDHRVERRHAEIYFRRGDFRLRDLSPSGVRINGKRAVDESLKDGDSIQLGPFELRVSIQAFRCGIEVIPPEPDRETPRYVDDGAAGAFFKTMYRMPFSPRDVPAHSGEEEEKNEKDRGSVRWVTPDDVKRSLRHPLVVITGILVSLAVTYVGLSGSRGHAVLGRPVSPAHSGVTFANDARAQFGAENDCAGCHAGETEAVDACRSCHESRPLRPKHEALAGGPCTDCHNEHLASVNTAIIPSGRCVACHEDRHARFLPVDGVPVREKPPQRQGFAVDIKADVAFEEEPRVEALHRSHRSLEARCRACHLGANQQERATGTAYQACFGCHGPEQALASEQCASCHREHGDEWASPGPSQDQIAASSDEMWRSASVATLVMLGLVGLSIRLHRTVRRRGARDGSKAEFTPPPRTDGVVQCGGSGRGVARKLPRVAEHRCTGSGDCADACPYDVLHMDKGRPTVVRPELCHECRTCVSVCGPQALSMAVPGEPLPMISVPSLDANFQTGLGSREDGIYIIGDAAGKPFVKNGNNLGRWVVDHMLSDGIGPGSAEKEGFAHDVVIIGSGPAGLSAGLCAHEAGLSYVILEKGTDFAATIHSYPKKKKVMPTPEGVENVGPLPVWDASREEVLEAWEEKLSGLDLSLEREARVTGIEPDGVGFSVHSQKGPFRGLRVVIASGSRGEPRRLGKPGDDLPKVLYRLADPGAYHRQHCMVVGGGDSALEAACALAEVHGGSNTVSIVYRQDRFTRAKPANQARIAEMIAAGRIEAFMEMNPREVKRESVVLETKGGDVREVQNDTLFCMLGANLPTKWLEGLGIEIVQKPADWDPGRSDQFAFQRFSPGTRSG